MASGTESPKIKLDTKLAEDAVDGASVLKRKTRRTDKVSFRVDGENVDLTLVALTARELRDLQDNHPPRKSNAGDQQVGYNADTFPPAMFAAVIKEPSLSQDEWNDIFVSPSWSPGELGHLIDLCWSVCNRGFDVPFGGRG